LVLESRVATGDSLPQRLIQIGDQITRILDPNREPDQLRRDPRGSLLLGAELLVGGGRGVDDQRLRVSHVGEQREELGSVDQCPGYGVATFHAEGKDTPEATDEIFGCVSVLGVGLQARI
jgi:hypothetical protein